MGSGINVALKGNRKGRVPKVIEATGSDLLESEETPGVDCGWQIALCGLPRLTEGDKENLSHCATYLWTIALELCQQSHVLAGILYRVKVKISDAGW